MSQYIFKMPDLGEGTVDAEIVAWHAKPGDQVTEDQLIVEVMTDKAAVEVPAPVSGRVLSVSGAPGEKVAVGSPLIVFELSDDSAAQVPAAAAPAPAAAQAAAPKAAAVPRADRSSRAWHSCGTGHDVAGESAPRARSRCRSLNRGGLGARRTHRAQ